MAARAWDHPLADCPDFVTEAVANITDGADLARAVLSGDGDAAIAILRAAVEQHATNLRCEFRLDRLRAVYGPALGCVA